MDEMTRFTESHPTHMGSKTLGGFNVLFGLNSTGRRY